MASLLEFARALVHYRTIDSGTMIRSDGRGLRMIRREALLALVVVGMVPCRLHVGRGVSKAWRAKESNLRVSLEEY